VWRGGWGVGGGGGGVVNGRSGFERWEVGVEVEVEIKVKSKWELESRCVVDGG